MHFVFTVSSMTLFSYLWTGTSLLHSQASYSIHKSMIPEVFVSFKEFVVIINLSPDGMGLGSLQGRGEQCCLMRLVIAKKNGEFVLFCLSTTHSQLFWCKMAIFPWLLFCSSTTHSQLFWCKMPIFPWLSLLQTFFYWLWSNTGR